MESSNFVMGLITIFIGAAILLAVGVQVLGNVQTSTNCTTLPGYNSSGTVVTPYTNVPQQKYSGWALSCINSNSQAQGGYSLIMVILIVIAAVAILAVVRLL